MEWSLTKVAAGLAAASVLFMVYLHLAAVHRRRYLFIWTLAWALYLARYVIFFWMPQSHGLSPVPVIYATLALVGAYLLLWGTREFLGKSQPVAWLWVLIITYFWTLAGAAMGVSFVMSTLPCALALAATYVRCGVEYWRAPKIESAGRALAVLGFFIWGAVQASYSFIINHPIYAQYGYIITTGLEVWASISLLLLFFQQNRRDLLDAKEVQAQSGKRLQLALEYMPLLMYALDTDGRVAVWNKECERVTGYAADEIKGQKNVVERLFPNTSADAEVLAAWEAPDAEFIQREIETVCADGEVKLIAWSNISKLVPIPGWLAWGVGVDLSERQRARQALKQLAAGVAHNFNNVLMAVMGNLQAAVPLLSSAKPETVKAIELVGNALKSAVAGRELGARLGAYVGGVKGDQRRLEPVELAPAVQAALDLARTGWSHLGLNTVEFRTSLGEGVFVRARRGELMEVFLNLIKNAMEAMPKGGVLSLSQEEKDGEVWLSFSDTGPGMDSETRARAFDPFFSTKGAAVRGLGLSSSRGILRSFQGELEVRESGDPGATLVVKLKREKPAETIAPSPPATRFASGGHVLLVEDEALVALGLEAMLVQAGYSVRKAGSLHEAREALAQEKPDVVLCDMVLPDGLGSDLAKEAEGDGAGQPTVPFVILTGWSPELTQQTQEWESFAEAVLHKPVERGSLLNAIAQALADCKTTNA